MDKTLNRKSRRRLNRRLRIMKESRYRLKIKAKLSKLINKVMWILTKKQLRQISMKVMLKRKKINNKIKANKYKNK